MDPPGKFLVVLTLFNFTLFLFLFFCLFYILSVSMPRSCWGIMLDGLDFVSLKYSHASYLHVFPVASCYAKLNDLFLIQLSASHISYTRQRFT